MQKVLKANISVHILTIFLISLILCGAVRAESDLLANKEKEMEGKAHYLSPAEIKEDFANLYRGLKSGHYDLYINYSKQSYDAAYQKLFDSITKPMTKLEVQVLFQKFAALGKIAHAKIDLPVNDYRVFREKGGKAFPLYVKTVATKVYVTESYSTGPIELGSEIISINDIPITEFLSVLKQYLSADTDIMANGFIEFYLPMLMWLEFGEQSNYLVELVSSSGKTEKLIVESMTQTEMESVNQKVQAKNTNYLQLGMERVAKVLNKHIAYLRPGPFYNTDPKAKDVWNAKSFKTFIDSAIKEFNQSNVKSLIIDLRNNPGGNNSFSDLLIQKFATKQFSFTSKFSVKVSPEAIRANNQRLALNPDDKESFSAKIAKEYSQRDAGEKFLYPIDKVLPQKVFNKPVYVLVNRHSYSNAVLVAAIIQDYGFGKVLGEETTDLATTYGAMEHFQLNHTQLKVGFPKAFIVRPSGDDSVRGVVPDIVIKTPILESGDDPVLKQALDIIEKI